MRRYSWGFVAAMLVGLGAPHLEVALACRRPISEGCVWGRALLPVNVVASLVILGIPTFLVVVWLLGRRGKAK
jgi:hypothetical protein